MTWRYSFLGTKTTLTSTDLLFAEAVGCKPRVWTRWDGPKKLASFLGRPWKLSWSCVCKDRTAVGKMCGSGVWLRRELQVPSRGLHRVLLGWSYQRVCDGRDM